MTPEQMLLIAHKAIVVPNLIYFYIITNFIFLLIGLLTIKPEGQHPYKKFFIIWFISSIVVGGVLLFFIYSPFTLQKITNILTSIWK